MSQPTVSVIIPTRNRAELVSRAIASVLAQTFRDFEIIVVDDGSTDDTRAAVLHHGADRIRYIRHPTAQGAARARNRGIESAHGEFIAFLDDDDEWLPEKLEKQLAVFRASDDQVGVVYAGFETISDSSGRVFRTYRPTPGSTSHMDFLESSVFMTSIPLIRRSCIDAVGAFDESLPGCQDKDLWIRLAKRFAFASMPDVVAKYHVHGAQITTDLPAKIRAKEQILLKYLDDLTPHPRLLAKHLLRIGMMHCAAGSPVEGRRYLLEALEADPRRRELRHHIMLSLLDPEAHRKLVIRDFFTNVEGVTLFY